MSPESTGPISASPESTGPNEHYLTAIRRGFRTWRGDRPFWAGLFTMAGGLPIAYFPYANLHLGNITLAMSTTAGAGSLIIGVLLVTLGLTMWFHSIVRVFAGVAAILLALISIPVANIGGFVMGFLLALIGGALSVSWAPGIPDAGEDAEGQVPVTAGAPLDVRDTPHDGPTAAVALPRQQTGLGKQDRADGEAHRAE
ncbi:DUF6114 domain-containing protein [Streptomyces nitrosporeus]|uniref:Monovalent cation/H(+) antiporter subunit G n=1 Tax=Streptomyces nitrosporeus TaxID=28894 RepID=A0A5J6FAY9_9ACTN|nr:DUF6114 domain-containing protein [Streptomyces nitrosporeus]QEU72235.1 hypothetical protein CP967_09805 [Streptomyces nitrosporeus]GGY79489.1 hypothetical protein GCM10010327_07390 [Streptomyces nitrosporeus]